MQRMLPRAHVVKVSTDDLVFLSEGADLAGATKWLLELGPSVVLRTDGDRPVHAVTASNELVLDVRPVDVVDTVGAGDAFGGAFLGWWIAHGLSTGELGDLDALRSAANVAIEVSARTCERPGADPPRITDLPEPWQQAFGLGTAP
jgi:fructokinase